MRNTLNTGHKMPPNSKTGKEAEKEPESEGFLVSSKADGDRGANGDQELVREPKKSFLNREESRVTDHPWIDKGWAWMVALGGMSVMFVCMGQIRNMGLLLAEVKIVFSESTAMAAVLPSVVYLIMPMMSPISSVLTAHYGSRPVVLVGVVCTVLAHVSVMFATNIVHILIFYAIPLAIGTGLCYTASCIIIGSYFHKRTSFAFGLASSGAPIAGMTLPSFYTYLSGQFGFKGAILLLGGTAAHAAIGACLMRSLSFWEPTKTSIELVEIQSEKSEQKPEMDVEQITKETHGDGSLTRLNSYTSQISKRNRTISLLSDTMTASQMELNTEIETEATAEQDVPLSNKLASCFKRINGIFRFTLLKEPSFLIHLISACCGFVGYVLPFALTPSHALDLGVERSLAYFLISIGGIGDFPSRYILSYIADRWTLKPYGRKYHIMSVCMVLCGLNSILMAFANSYGALCAHIALIGFFGGGGFIAAHIAVLKEIIGLTKTANGGLGIVMFTSGILIGFLPPVMGLIRDTYGSFQIPFIMIGVIMIFGGCFNWFHVLANRHAQKKAAKQAEQTSC